MPDPVLAATSSRERILDAAIQVFASKGFASTSTRQIAEVAGVKEPLLFYHFKSKASLYQAAFEDQIAKLAEGLDAALAGQEDPRARLRSFVECYLRYHIDLEPGLGVTVRELNGLPAGLVSTIGRLHHEWLTARLIEVLGSGAASGVFRAINVRASAAAILGIMLYFIRIQKRDFGHFTRDEMIEQVLDYYAVGLLSAPPASAREREAGGQPGGEASLVAGGCN